MLAVTFTTNTQTNTPDTQNERKEAKEMKPKFGIKTGYNIAKVTGSTPDYSPNRKNGFMVSASYSTPNESGFGYRNEVVFSHQGFGFNEAGKTTSVTSDYIYLP